MTVSVIVTILGVYGGFKEVDNVGLSWVGVIVGEFMVSQAGIGYLIVYGGQVFKLDLVMTSVIILAILATVMYQGVAYFEKKMMKWR
ncbi:putative aliphatic sulfonates transport permease protein SsuC [Thermotalea metallivorans]|uniref:Putative aliphatic sulfonates transport permease protein SsuC n=2 Tax=Thermotalea metallivorans TaxID=520762 RepID=A0A140L7Y8_9FIRM|nr:putative aliphatic sulfonates transport permease protein SsuC [Thermotalea metallivorans]